MWTKGTLPWIKSLVSQKIKNLSNQKLSCPMMYNQKSSQTTIWDLVVIMWHLIRWRKENKDKISSFSALLRSGSLHYKNSLTPILMNIFLRRRKTWDLSQTCQGKYTRNLFRHQWTQHAFKSWRIQALAIMSLRFRR